MILGIIQKKLKEPSLPYFFTKRETFSEYMNQALLEEKSFFFLQGLTGYGKTLAVQGYLKNNSIKNYSWYTLDEWDKDPVMFLKYLYNSFKVLNISSGFEEYFSQPLNSDGLLKGFIGTLCNELEAVLKDNYYLILDGFQEIENDPVILKIITFLFNYCPENLKIIVLSSSGLPDELYSFYIKQELYEFSPNTLLLTENEALEVFEKLSLTNKDTINELIKMSNSCITIFTLLAQNYSRTEDFINSYKESKIYKNSVREIAFQIYKNFPQNIKDFILQTILLPKINLKTLETVFPSQNLKQTLSSLEKSGIVLHDISKQEYYYSQVFINTFEEILFSLEEQKRKEILNNILKFSKDETPENLIQIFIKSNDYNKAFDLLKESYEYYFREHLYGTLLKLLENLKVNGENLLTRYLDIRLKRVTGKFTLALEQISEIEEKSILIKIEEGICKAAIGNFEQAIDILKKLEDTPDLELKDKLNLINGLGISYLHIHKLDLALEYFNKAIDLKSQLIFKHDLIKIYHNMGLGYTWKGDFSKAIESYEQSLYLSKQLKVPPLAMTYNNLAIIHNLQGSFEKAYSNCIEGLEVVRKFQNIRDEIYIYITLTDTYRGLNNGYKVEECITYLEDLLSKNPISILDALLMKQKSYNELDKKNYEKSKEFLYNAIHIRKLGEGDPSLLEYKLELGILEHEQGNYEKSKEQLDEIEIDVRKGGHNYHLARLYVYQALNFNNLKDNSKFEYYKKLSFEIIEKYNFSLLETKLRDLKKDISVKEEKTISQNISENTGNFRITTFGDFSVSNNNKEIQKKSWSGKKTKLLFVYLLMNKIGSTKEKVYSSLFPDGDKSRSALHVLINRLRKAISEVFDQESIQIITYQDDLYNFNFSIDYWWDAERFEYLIRKANDNTVVEEEQIQLKEQALELYQGHFMVGFELEDWIYSQQEYYRQMAYKTYNELCKYYLNTNEYNKLLSISLKVFKIDNCYEKACENAMKALIFLNKKKQALEQYKILEHSLSKTLNDEPSSELQELRDSLLTK